MKLGAHYPTVNIASLFRYERTYSWKKNGGKSKTRVIKLDITCKLCCATAFVEAHDLEEMRTKRDRAIKNHFDICNKAEQGIVRVRLKGVLCYARAI